MKRISSLILALGIALGGVSQAQVLYPEQAHCDRFVPYGYPQPTEAKRETTPLCRIAYFTLHDDKRKTPVYSAELLLPENVDGDEPRKNNFRPDPLLHKSKRAENIDYRYSGWDRGHMAPAEDFRRDSVLMSQSFYLSNMIPQNPSLNRGIWRMLEHHVVTRVRNGEELFVITGPIYDNQRGVKTIGPNKVHVPSHVFKVVMNLEQRKYEAFIIPNKDIDGSWTNFRVPLSQVEEKAKLNLFPQLDKELSILLRH